MSDVKYAVAYSHFLKKYVISSYTEHIDSHIMLKSDLRANSKVLTKDGEFIHYVQIMRSSKHNKEIVVFDNEQEAEVSLLKFKRQKKLEKIS
jgi:hypothetical protein